MATINTNPFAQYPTDCVLCGKSSETHIEHLKHMEQIHDAIAGNPVEAEQ